MPTSNPSCISAVVDLILRMKPRSILDVGPGFGKYGVLAREYSELWLRENLEKEKWKTVIDCIEPFEKYITELHRFVYNKIYIQDVITWMKSDQKEGERRLGDYDLVILSDILEHLGREEGLALLDGIKGSYIVTTPYMFVPQNPVYGNEYEKHVSQWNKEDFEKSKVVGNVILGWKHAKS